jgi:hypothetical protein
LVVTLCRRHYRNYNHLGTFTQRNYDQLSPSRRRNYNHLSICTSERSAAWTVWLFTQIQLNIPKYTQIYQNIPKYTQLYPNTPNYTQIHHKTIWFLLFWGVLWIINDLLAPLSLFVHEFQLNSQVFTDNIKRSRSRSGRLQSRIYPNMH